MNVLETPQYLVHEIACMVVAEGLVGVNNVMQVRLHEVQYKVDVVESCRVIGGTHHLTNGYDVVVVEVA